MRRSWLVAAANLVGVLVLYFAVPVTGHGGPGRLAASLLLTVGGAAVVAGVVVLELRRQVRGVAPGLTPVTLVLLLEVVVVVFAFAYYTLERHDPGQLVGLTTRLDALYFSMVTMATVGYGDVHAEGQVARALVASQLVVDVVFLAALTRVLGAAMRSRLTGRE